MGAKITLSADFTKKSFENPINFPKFVGRTHIRPDIYKNYTYKIYNT